MKPFPIWCDMCAKQNECHIADTVPKCYEPKQTEPNSSEKPNNCEECKWWNESYGCHWKEGVCHYVPKVIIPKQCVSCDSASRIIEAYSQGFKDGADAVKAMPQTFTADGIVFAKMDEPQTERYCTNCKHSGVLSVPKCDECQDMNKHEFIEPQTDTEIAKAIVHKMIDDAVIAEDAYPDLRQKMHDAVDEYEPQTDGYMTAEQAEDYRKMLDKAEHKVYGNIEDEPQTDCSWK